MSPYILDMAGIARGATVMDSLAWRPHLGSRILLVSRTTGREVCSIPVGARYCLHTINCWEADGLVILDVIEMSRPVYDA